VAALSTEQKPGNTIQVVGQIDSMNSSFINLGIGLLFALMTLTWLSLYAVAVASYWIAGDG